MSPQTKNKQPKTHSDILWHFTGGAPWSNTLQRQLAKPKTVRRAFEAFIQILNSRILRVGGYHEIIKCTIPVDKVYNLKTKQFENQRNVTRVISTSPVCCVADIPLTELFHHGKRYGKIAIGFKRNSLLRVTCPQ